ncbi:hypothetical protein D9M72_623950 [compost metagenome]
MPLRGFDIFLGYQQVVVSHDGAVDQFLQGGFCEEFFPALVGNARGVCRSGISKVFWQGVFWSLDVFRDFTCCKGGKQYQDSDIFIDVLFHFLFFFVMDYSNWFSTNFFL